MLVISRKLNETLLLGEEIKIRVLGAKRDSVRLGIDAPSVVPVVRGELLEQVKRQNEAALSVDPSALLGRNRKVKSRPSVRVPSFPAAKLLASWLTHEVRNYLTPIDGEIQLAQMDCGDDSLRVGLTAADKQVKQLGAWLRKVSKLGSSAISRGTESELEVMLSSGLENWNGPTRVSLNCRSGIPFPVTHPPVEFPITQLLRNAEEAGAKRVTVSVECGKGRTRIVVEDDGQGIDRCTLENLTETFFTTKQKQAGLGLALVRNWVDGFCGELMIESVLGEGAKVILVLPREWPDSKPKESRVILQSSFGSAEQRALQEAGYRVLLAEDEEQLSILSARFPELDILTPESLSHLLQGQVGSDSSADGQ